MEENKAHIEITKIINDFSKKISNDILYPKHYNLEEIFINIKNNPLKEKHQLFETLINEYLLKIKQLDKIDILDTNYKKKFDEILDMFIIEKFATDEIDTETFYDLEIEAECVSVDLILKLLGNENRTLTLPINITSIIEFSINNTIKQKYINEVIMLIILNLSITYYILLEKTKL